MKKSQFERIEDSMEETRERMENDLVALHAEKMPDKVTDEERTEWILNYKEPFLALIHERPDLLSLYNEKRKEALRQIDEILYKKTV